MGSDQVGVIVTSFADPWTVLLIAYQSRAALVTTRNSTLATWNDAVTALAGNPEDGDLIAAEIAARNAKDAAQVALNGNESEVLSAVQSICEKADLVIEDVLADPVYNTTRENAHPSIVSPNDRGSLQVLFAAIIKGLLKQFVSYPV